MPNANENSTERNNDDEEDLPPGTIMGTIQAAEFRRKVEGRDSPKGERYYGAYRAGSCRACTGRGAASQTYPDPARSGHSRLSARLRRIMRDAIRRWRPAA